MYLTSSLEPTGPKSTHHYIVLHLNDQSELIELPKTYSDLQTEIERLYHLDGGRFHVETRELSICPGKPIRIPERLWSGIAELLGNVYIVLRAFDPQPKLTSQPTPLSLSSGTVPSTTYPPATVKPVNSQVLETGDNDIVHSEPVTVSLPAVEGSSATVNNDETTPPATVTHVNSQVLMSSNIDVVRSESVTTSLPAVEESSTVINSDETTPPVGAQSQSPPTPFQTPSLTTQQPDANQIASLGLLEGGSPSLGDSGSPSSGRTRKAMRPPRRPVVMPARPPHRLRTPRGTKDVSDFSV